MCLTKNLKGSGLYKIYCNVSTDAPIIGSVIGSVADMAETISAITVIGINALGTDIAVDSLRGKYECQFAAMKSLFAHYNQIESLSTLFYKSARL